MKTDKVYRTENDSLGKLEIPIDAFYGIHAQRARENFTNTSPFHLEWYKAVGMVKLAIYMTYKKFIAAAKEKYDISKLPFDFIPESKIDLLIDTAKEISKGKYFEHFIVPAIQGGAGTSINMNINEIIANVCLQKSGKELGNYKCFDPIEHANVFQSTNDVIPTSLKLACMQLLNELETAINDQRYQLEQLERKHQNHLRIGYTQMQEAVPSSYGKLFSTYNEALSRDWWRVSKCFERIKLTNLGGSAIGTGIAVPRFIIMEAINQLQTLSNLPITRSENMDDATANLDAFVEVHAVLKAHAVNLEKMVCDLRLLASDLIDKKEVIIPQKQVGSSIMPSKVNPVIPEFVVSVAHKVYANDMLVSSLAAQGVLDLNAYTPIIGHALLESIKMLIAANTTIQKNLIDGLIINNEVSLKKLYHSPSITTALVPYIGYNKAGLLATTMRNEHCCIFEANKKLGLLPAEIINKALSTAELLKTGFSLSDILEQ